MIPFIVVSDIGILTNLGILITLVVFSTYTLSALKPDNANLDVENIEMIKKDLGGSWVKLLWFSMSIEFLLYGLLLIFFSVEIMSYVAFDRNSKVEYYLATISVVLVLYLIVIWKNLENQTF